jgi:diguanylate cyclase (GGDEF)-like protein
MTKSGKCVRGCVIVVDDNAAQRHLISLQLVEEGFVVHTFTSGDECLKNAAALDPDVILLDIQMPGMDGIETCRRLKRHHDTHAVPVVFLTGHSDDEATMVEALRAGGNDFISKDSSPIVLLTRVNCQMMISSTQRQLRQMIMTDELTGLYSRRFLFDTLRRILKAIVRVQYSGVALLVADLDHFKKINDTYGHLEGDRVLRNVAKILQANTRETDCVARFGGEEFVILLPATGIQGALIVAEKVRAAVEASGPTTVSLGVTCAETIPHESIRGNALDDLISRLLREADAAMYVSKVQGRNRATVWHPELAP